MPHRDDVVLRLIAVFKLLKGTALVIVAVGALELVNRGLAHDLREWLLVLQPSHSYVARAIAEVSSLQPHTLELISVATSLYAGLFLVEGYGLWRARVWAEYLTTGITTSFIPLEVYELAERASLAKVGVIVVNVAIVVYLVWKLRRDRRWPFR